MVTPIECQYCTYCHLYIGHGMVKTGTDDTHQLTAGINNIQPWTLVIALVPFLGTMMHLDGVVGSKGETFEMTASSNSPCLNKVLKGETIKSPLGTSRTLRGLVDVFSLRIGPTWIVTSGPGVLAVVIGLKPLEALHLGIVDVLGEGDESRRRRSVGSRHFDVENGSMV